MRLGPLALAACAARGPAEPPPEAAHPAAPEAARSAPRADLIYFVMVDRFANGDPSNDGAIDLADPQAFHGGDLQGLRARLDHLDALGVGTLWLSPVFDMREEPFHGWGAFHGYWVDDLGAVEPRFGGEAALRALVEAARGRGMRVVLDMVWNHVGFDAPLRQSHPHWFHPDRPIEDWNDPVQLESHTVHGLPDLDQDHPEVYAHLRETSLAWARDYGVQGFRVDAVRHMPARFLARMSADLHEALGPDFLLLGEDFQGEAGALARSMAAGGFDAMFDFPLYYAMVDVFCQDRPVGRLATTLSSDRLYADAGALVTFLDNHDLPRVMSACGEDRARVDQAALFQFFTRGTPSVTWGSELYVSGAEEPSNRADMPWERAGEPTWIGELAALRAEHQPHLGEPRILVLTPELLVMARLGERGASLLAVNTGEEDQTAPLPGFLAGGRVEAWRQVGPEGVVRAPPEGWDPRGEGIPVPAGSTLGLVMTAPSPHGLRPLLALPEPAPVQTPVAVEVPGLGEGHRLLLVGSGPELGSWVAEEGLALDRVGDGRWEARFEAPDNVALAMKLVAVGPDGVARWQEGPDHVHLVAPGAPLTLRWDDYQSSP